MESKIISFKAKYQLNDDDMKCIRVLKDAVLNDMIQKKETLIDNIKNSPTAKKAISIAQVASDTLAKGSAAVKERLGLLAASNPNAAEMAAAAKEKVGAFLGDTKNMLSNIRKPGGWFGGGRRTLKK